MYVHCVCVAAHVPVRVRSRLEVTASCFGFCTAPVILVAIGEIESQDWLIHDGCHKALGAFGASMATTTSGTETDIGARPEFPCLLIAR